MFAPILFFVASFLMKSKIVGVEDMDFISGVDEVIAESYDEPPPRNFWEKFWQWIVSVLDLTLSRAAALIGCVYSSNGCNSISRYVFKLSLPKLQRFSLNSSEKQQTTSLSTKN
jgi:hypothetical protein